MFHDVQGTDCFGCNVLMNHWDHTDVNLWISITLDHGCTLYSVVCACMHLCVCVCAHVCVCVCVYVCVDVFNVKKYSGLLDKPPELQVYRA